MPARVDGQGPDWLHAGPYVRLHLATHAAAAGRIAELLRDPLFLVATDPDHLIEVLPYEDRSPEIRVVVNVVTRAGRALFVRDDGERAAYLQMTARKLKADALASALAALAIRIRWSVSWARWRGIADGAGLIGAQHEPVRTVSSGAGLIAACTESALSVWRLEPRRIVSVLRSEHLRGVRSAAAVPGGAVTTHADGSLLWHDLATGDAQPWTPKREVGAPSHSMSLSYEGRDLLVLIGAAATRLWDPARNQPAGPLLPVTSRALAAATVRGIPLLLTEREGTVQAWDLVAGKAYSQPFRPFEDDGIDPDGRLVWSGALGEIDGHAVAVLGSHVARPILRWNLDTGTRGGDSLPSPEIGTLSLGIGGGLLSAGGADGRLRQWAWPLGSGAGVDIAAHEGGVAGLATAALGGLTVVVTGGRDGATRVWFPDVPVASTDGQAHDLTVGQVLRLRSGRRERLLAITEDNRLVLTDTANGHTIAERRMVAGRDLAPLAHYRGPGPADVAIGMEDGSVHLIDSVTLRTRQRLTPTDPGQIAALATTSGRVLVATRAGELQVWDPERPRQVYPAIDLGSPVSNLLPVNRLVVASGRNVIRAIDLADGRPSAWQPAKGCSSGSGIWRIVAGKLAGRQVAVGVGAGAHVHVWDLTDGALLADMDLGLGSNVGLSDAVVARLHGRSVVISGSYNGLLAIWDLDGLIGEPIDVGPAILTVATVGSDTVIAGGLSGMIAIKLSRGALVTGG